MKKRQDQMFHVVSSQEKTVGQPFASVVVQCAEGEPEQVGEVG